MSKEGIDSFLLDCHTNENMAEIENTFSIKGFAIVVRLWQKIYSEKGYYCEWSERSPVLFLSQWFGGGSGVDENLIREVVALSLKIGIFDRNMYERFQILTSKRLQEQYFDVVKRRTEIKIIKDYLLISVDNFKENVNIIQKNVNTNSKNVSSFSTSKVKESKVKGSKENNTSTSVDGRSAFNYQSVVKSFNSICVSLPKVQNLTETRRKKIKNASKLLGNLSFEDVFNMVENSDFLSGRTDKWNGCSFDWILNTTNLTKIIEGNYNNKRPKQQSTSSYDINELEKFNTLDDIEV